MDGVQRTKRGTESKVTSGEWYYQKEKNISLHMSMTAYSLRRWHPLKTGDFRCEMGEVCISGIWGAIQSSAFTRILLTHTSRTLKPLISSVQFSRSVVYDSSWPHGLQHARPPRPWDSPGKNTGVDCHALLQGIFLTQGSNPSLLCLLDCLLKLMSIESVMPSNYLILCGPLLLLPLIFPSIRVFSNESVLHVRWPEYWSFSFSISPSNEYSGLISFSFLISSCEKKKNL